MEKEKLKLLMLGYLIIVLLYLAGFCSLIIMGMIPAFIEGSTQDRIILSICFIVGLPIPIFLIHSLVKIYSAFKRNKG